MSRKTKQLAVTLPIEISLKVDEFSQRCNINNNSAVISGILEQFLNVNNETDAHIKKNPNSAFVPASLYMKIENMSKKVFETKISSKKIKTIMICMKEYVVLDKKSDKNIYEQVSILKEKTDAIVSSHEKSTDILKSLNSKIPELEKMITELEANGL